MCKPYILPIRDRPCHFPVHRMLNHIVSCSDMASKSKPYALLSRITKKSWILCTEGICWPSIDRQYLTDMLTNTWSICRTTLGRMLVDMFFNLVDSCPPLLVNSWSVCRLTLGWHLDLNRLSAAYLSTIGGILCIVNHCFCWNSLKCKGTREERVYS